MREAFVLVAVSAVWGIGYLAGTVALGALDAGFGPLWLVASRLLVAGALLSMLAVARGAPLPRGLPGIAASGALAWVVGTGMLTIGLQWVPAGTTALVLAGSPVVALVLDGLWRRAPPPRAAVAWLLVAVAGLVVLVGPAPLAVPGIGWTLAACLAWAAAQVVESRREDGSDPLAVAAIQIGVGGVGVSALAFASGEPLPAPGTASWLGWAFLVGPSTVLALPAWLWLLRRVPVHVSQLQAALSPVVALVASAALGWEALGPREAVASALILGAAWQAARPREVADPAPAPEAVPDVPMPAVPVPAAVPVVAQPTRSPLS